MGERGATAASITSSVIFQVDVAKAQSLLSSAAVCPNEGPDVARVLPIGQKRPMQRRIAALPVQPGGAIACKTSLKAPYCT